MDLFSMAAGVCAVGVVYFIVLCAAKGIPAAWSFIKARLGSAEKALVLDVQKGVASAQAGVASAQADIATMKTDIAAIKAKLGL